MSTMRIIALTFSALSVFMIAMTMAAGLSVAHGENLIMSHLYWGFGALSVVLLTLTLCLLFIFKMHGIIHDLVAKLEVSPPNPPLKVRGGQEGEI
jgi:hypothetical protein